MSDTVTFLHSQSEQGQLYLFSDFCVGMKQFDEVIALFQAFVG